MVADLGGSHSILENVFIVFLISRAKSEVAGPGVILRSGRGAAHARQKSGVPRVF